MNKDRYSKDCMSAEKAQRLAHEIVFGPVIFQVTRMMVRAGIFSQLSDNREGCTAEEIEEKTGLSAYAVKVLLESSLTAGTILEDEGRFFLSKAGWFILNDRMALVNLNFNHDVNYKGFFHLEEALREGRPAGLKELGNWPTIYEGLSSLEPEVKKSWFDFDHFYSDSSFDEALPIVFASKPRRLLDIGGNTGKWASKCIAYDPSVEVTIMDLPQQIRMMQEHTAGLKGAERIHGYGADLLKPDTVFPEGFDVVWMSQFLDCFSAEQVVGILKKASPALAEDGRIFIMETLWDRQKYPTASYDLAQISLYFTVMANGNSKMFNTEDLFGHIDEAGLETVAVHDGLGYGHTLIECRRK